MALWLKWIRHASTAAVVLLAAGGIAQAQQNCGPRNDLVAHLGEKYQEQQFGYGTAGNLAIVEIYVSKTGTWTVIVTDLAGKSCIVAAGENWETTLFAALPEA